MWLMFESCEFRTDLSSKAGKMYSAHVLNGTKKGWQEEPDEPWSKTFFDGDMAIVKQGSAERNMHLSEFFGLCQPGDLIDVKQEKTGPKFWKIIQVENKSRSVIDDAAVATSNSPSVNPAVLEEIKATVTVGALASAGAYTNDLKDKDAFEIEEFIDSEIDKRVKPNLPMDNI